MPIDALRIFDGRRLRWVTSSLPALACSISPRRLVSPLPSIPAKLLLGISDYIIHLTSHFAGHFSQLISRTARHYATDHFAQIRADIFTSQVAGIQDYYFIK